MARFRIRGVFPNGQTCIVKVTADDPYAAAGSARKEIADAGHNVASISSIKVTRMENAKSSVYVGAVPSGKPRGGKAKKDAVATPAPTPTPTTPATTPAKPTTAAAKK